MGGLAAQAAGQSLLGRGGELARWPQPLPYLYRPHKPVLPAPQPHAAPAALCRHSHRRRHPLLGDQLPAAVPDPLAAEMIFEATGVPLLDELMRMCTVDAAIQHSLKLAGIAVAVAVMGSMALSVVDRMAGRRIAQFGRDFNVPFVALASAFKPAKVLLPYYAVAYITTVASALAQVAATKLKKDFAVLCRGTQEEVLGTLRFFTQLVQDTSELLIIIFVAWALIDFKNRLLQWLATSILSDLHSSNDAALTMMRPLAGVLTFLILLGATAFAMGAYGLNLAPLIASVGGIGVVVGLATQGLLTNVVSAVALYTARPFVVGDEVHLLAAGSLVVRGTIVQMEPMRTVIKSDDGGVVYINNAEVTKYIIKNMTQGRSLAAVGTVREQAHREGSHPEGSTS